jgi:hypothetical protein
VLSSFQSGSTSLWQMAHAQGLREALEGLEGVAAFVKAVREVSTSR